MGKKKREKKVEGLHVMEIVLDGETVVAMGKDDPIPPVEVPIAMVAMIGKIYGMPIERIKAMLDIINDYIIEASHDSV